MSEHNDMPSRVTRLENIVTRLEVIVGYASTDGLRGDIKKLEDNIDKVIERIAVAEKKFAAMLGGGLVIVWMIEKFLSK